MSATVPAFGPEIKEIMRITEMNKTIDSLPEYVKNCPVVFEWHRYKGVEYFCMLNVDRSLKSKRAMIDLAYCATKGMNGIIEKTVQYSKKHFKKSKLK